MSIRLTENAARRIRDQLAKRGKGIGLRLGIKVAGCSGYSYVIDYADAIEADDVVFEDHGVKVVVKREDLDYLEGLEVDYRREGLNEAFQFNNPKAKATCGCGESFTV
ncbi:MAG: iron-sulfur cluster assembly protein IscA [Methylothermaceae bacteria B42]|nr:MAG: iron-sulfur cluster assembly protein IscA [Methylothermaceae bacteria B42]HHJ39974.1 iron-sulfur cluster assembly accessory protein [Methylothermaceae bacterium]